MTFHLGWLPTVSGGLMIVQGVVATAMDDQTSAISIDETPNLSALTDDPDVTASDSDVLVSAVNDIPTVETCE